MACTGLPWLISTMTAVWTWQVLALPADGSQFSFKNSLIQPKIESGISAMRVANWKYLLINILLGLETLGEGLQRRLLVIRRGCDGSIHFFGGVGEIALPGIHA